jgi:predicted nucleic acid-binding protein
VTTARAVLDACLLAPHPLYDTLLPLAEAGLFRPLWSKEILVETQRTVVTKLDEPPEKARKRIAAMERSFPDAMTVGFEAMIPEMTNDPKDRHVLAAAVTAGADVIVTANLPDFPDAALAPHGIEAVHPDAFLLGLLAERPDEVVACRRQQRAEFTNPVQSLQEFYASFTATVPKFAAVCATREQPSTASR